MSYKDNKSSADTGETGGGVPLGRFKGGFKGRGNRNPLLCAFFGYFLGTQESNVKKKKADAFFKGAKTVRSFAPEPTQKGLFEKSPS